MGEQNPRYLFLRREVDVKTEALEKLQANYDTLQQKFENREVLCDALKTQVTVMQNVIAGLQETVRNETDGPRMPPRSALMTPIFDDDDDGGAGVKPPSHTTSTASSAKRSDQNRSDGGGGGGGGGLASVLGSGLANAFKSNGSSSAAGGVGGSTTLGASINNEAGPVASVYLDDSAINGVDSSSEDGEADTHGGGGSSNGGGMADRWSGAAKASSNNNNNNNNARTNGRPIPPREEDSALTLNAEPRRFRDTENAAERIIDVSREMQDPTFGVHIEGRWRGIWWYPDVFTGSDFADWLLATQSFSIDDATNKRRSAVLLAQKLLDLGCFADAVNGGNTRFADSPNAFYKCLPLSEELFWQRIERLEKDTGLLRRHAAALASKIADRNERITRLRNELVNARDEAAASSIEADALHHRLQDVEADLLRARKAKETGTSALEEARESAATAEARVAELQSEVVAARKTIVELEASMEAKSAAAESEILALTERLDELETRRQKAEDAASSHIDHASNLQQAKAEMEATLAERERAIAAFNAQFAALGGAEAVDAIRKENVSLKKATSVLEADKAQLLLQVVQAENAKAAAVSEAERLADRVDELEVALTRERAERISAEDDLEPWRKQVATLKKMMQDDREESLAHAETATESAARIESLEEALADQERELERLRGLVGEGTEDAMAGQAATIAQLRGERADTAAKLIALEAVLERERAQHTEDLESIEKEKAGFGEQLSQIVGTLQGRISALEAELTRLGGDPSSVSFVADDTMIGTPPRSSPAGRVVATPPNGKSVASSPSSPFGGFFGRR